MHQRIRKPLLVGCGVLLAVGLAVSIALPSLSKEAPTFGTIPESVFVEGVAVDVADLPDYISVAGPDGGVVGYVKASYAWPILGHEADFTQGDAVPVVDMRLNLVGHMVPGKGFIPVGASIEDAPGFVVTTTIGSDGATVP